MKKAGIITTVTSVAIIATGVPAGIIVAQKVQKEQSVTQKVKERWGDIESELSSSFAGFDQRTDIERDLHESDLQNEKEQLNAMRELSLSALGVGSATATPNPTSIKTQVLGLENVFLKPITDLEKTVSEKLFNKFSTSDQHSPIEVNYDYETPTDLSSLRSITFSQGTPSIVSPLPHYKVFFSTEKPGTPEFDKLSEADKYQSKLTWIPPQLGINDQEIYENKKVYITKAQAIQFDAVIKETKLKVPIELSPVGEKMSIKTFISTSPWANSLDTLKNGLGTFHTFADVLKGLSSLPSASIEAELAKRDALENGYSQLRQAWETYNRDTSRKLYYDKKTTVNLELNIPPLKLAKEILGNITDSTKSNQSFSTAKPYEMDELLNDLKKIFQEEKVGTPLEAVRGNTENAIVDFVNKKTDSWFGYKDFLDLDTTPAALAKTLIIKQNFDEARSYTEMSRRAILDKINANDSVNLNGVKSSFSDSFNKMINLNAAIHNNEEWFNTNNFKLTFEPSSFDATLRKYNIDKKTLKIYLTDTHFTNYLKEIAFVYMYNEDGTPSRAIKMKNEDTYNLFTCWAKDPLQETDFENNPYNERTHVGWLQSNITDADGLQIKLTQDTKIRFELSVNHDIGGDRFENTQKRLPVIFKLDDLGSLYEL